MYLKGIVILFVLLLSACSSSENGSGATGTLKEIVRLEEHRKIWQQKNISDYMFNFRQSCFCGSLFAGGDKTIVVQDGEVVEAFYVNSGEYIGTEDLQYLRTLDEYFDYISDTLRSKPDKFKVEYNEEYGYPVYIYIDRDESSVDDELTIYISGFQ